MDLSEMCIKYSENGGRTGRHPDTPCPLIQAMIKFIISIID